MEKMQEAKPKKQPDTLKSLKYKGYCRSLTPPGDTTTMEDLVSFGKFFLCKQTHRLWKDPIWEEYTDEEILIEYFSYLFAMDEDTRKEFEASINAGSQIYGEDIYEWLDRKVKENQEENRRKFDDAAEKITFAPEIGKDVEE